MAQNRTRVSKPSQTPGAASRQPSTYTLAAHLSHPPIPGMVWVALLGIMISMTLVIFLMTPLTHNLDDIKITLFYLTGPVLMLIGLAAIYLKVVPLPPRVAGLALLGYGLVMVISTLFSNFELKGFHLVPTQSDQSWIAWNQTLFVWCAAGFFMSAFCVGSHRSSSRIFLRFLVLTVLATNLIGYFFFDVTNSPDHASGVAKLYKYLYPSDASRDGSALSNLLYTLYTADGALQSTVLNRDFYAGFLLLFLPFSLLMALDPGPTRKPAIWRSIGLVTALLTTLSIFLCQSKGELISGVFALAFCGLMFFRFGKIADLRRRHLLTWTVGLLLTLGLVIWLKSPTMMSQLKSLNNAFGSRRIIWSGAWQIFLHFPLLGGGPGTFRIYFPTYRAADYFNHDINNVTTFSHNYFLDILSETGSLGFICFITMLAALTLVGLNHALRHPDSRIRLYLSATIGALMGFYGSNLSSPNARWVIGAVPMWAVIGLLAGLIRQAEGCSRPKAQPLAANVPEIGEPALAVASPMHNWAKFLILGLGAIGVVALFCAYPTGLNYFNSAKLYNTGLMYMDQGMAINQAIADQEKANHPLDEQEKKEARAKALFYLETSTRHFDRAIKTDLTNESAYYKVGSVYTTLSGMYQEIAQQLRAKGKEQDADSYAQQSDEYLKQAKEAYETLAHYDPDYAEIHFNLGLIYQSWADYLKGKAAAARREANPTADPGALLKEASDYERRAVEHMDRMSTLSIKPEVSTELGRYYVQMKHYDKARDIFRAASDRYPADNDLAIYYYKTAYNVGDFKGAGEALRRLWVISPADDSRLDQLISTAQDHHLDSILEDVAKRLEKINPVHPRLYEMQLYLAADQKQPERMMASAKRYILCGGQDLEMYQMGAEAALALKKNEQAKEFYQQIVRIDHDGKTTYSMEARKFLNLVRQPAAEKTRAKADVAAPAAKAPDKATATHGGAPAPAATTRQDRVTSQR